MEGVDQNKVNFYIIKELYANINIFFSSLETRLKILKQYTEDFIISNNKLFVFGLDSFRFQIKVIEMEYSYLKRFYIYLTNRMYGDYYKLYKLILSYYIEVIKNEELNKMDNNEDNIESYRDLEPYYEYELSQIIKVHDTIMKLLEEIMNYKKIKESSLNIYRKKQKSGLHIDNFVHTVAYDVSLITQQITLFSSYLDFFHTIHVKQIQRLAIKLKLLYRQVNEDIAMEETNEPTSEIVLDPAPENSILTNTSLTITDLISSTDSLDTSIKESLPNINQIILQNIQTEENREKTKKKFRFGLKSFVRTMIFTKMVNTEIERKKSVTDVFNEINKLCTIVTMNTESTTNINQETNTISNISLNLNELVEKAESEEEYLCPSNIYAKKMQIEPKIEVPPESVTNDGISVIESTTQSNIPVIIDSKKELKDVPQLIINSINTKKNKKKKK
jgi:hypothetical protein